MKKWKEFVIRYCPNIRALRTCMGKIKSYQMAHGMAMKQKEITAGEKELQERDRLLKLYMHRYAGRTEQMRCMFEDYIKKAGIKMKLPEKEEVFKDVMFCHFAYGFRADEYFMYGLRGKTPLQRQEYISDRDMHAFIIYKMNDVVDKDILRNKIKMYEKFKQYYKRDAIGVKGYGDYDKVMAFMKKHPVFVEKAARENCGRAVRLIDTTKDNFKAEIYIQSLLEKDTEYLLEEKIEQSDEMSQLNSSSVNTLRIPTFYDGKNVKIFAPILRIGRKNMFIDNAVAGGIYAHVNEKTGIVESVVDVYRHTFEAHPDSGVMLFGFHIPEWDECCGIVQQLAISVPTIRYVGWDLAHTNEGWCFVEGNAHAQTHLVCQETCGAREKMLELSKIYKRRN